MAEIEIEKKELSKMAKKAGFEQSRKVLVIEDYPATIELISNLLRTEGIDVVTAVDGTSGLAQARSSKPSLILLDIMMPEMSGFEVCQKLKQDPKTARIPIIIVSVRAAEDDIKKGKDLGAIEYILKPFDPFKLVEIVKKYLGG